MHASRILKKTGAALVAASLLGTAVAPAQAAMVGTAQAIAVQQGTLDRARLAALLERADLQAQLAALGVDVQQARERVANLTDAEVARLNEQVGELPAGASSALGIVVLVFLILVITDLLGTTDVFPFVHPLK
jgi:hypothetical protein